MRPKLKKEWATANEAHYVYGVNRAWLRERWNNGNGDIARRAIVCDGYDGTRYTKYLYRCDDIERTLAKAKDEADNTERR